MRYIQRRAADHDSRIVTIGQLILFSRWNSEAIRIEETDTTFAIAWKGRYRIEGRAFIYSDRDTGRTTTILGCRTDKLVLTA